MVQPTATPARDQQRLDWTRAALSDPSVGLERASFDADFRSYWRTTGRTPSLILMDAPPERMDVRPWLSVRALLEAGGLRVPGVVAQDVEQGFVGGHRHAADLPVQANGDFLDHCASSSMTLMP